MTIKIEDGIDDLTAVSFVKQVIEQGKVSANGNSYCYLTLFGDIFVETRQYRKSPCFRVYKKKTVQELIEALNKVKDKSKEVLQNYYFSIDGIEERDDYVIVVLKEIQYDTTRKDTKESRGIWAACSSVP